MTTIEELWKEFDKSRNRFDSESVLSVLRNNSDKLELDDHRALVEHMIKSPREYGHRWRVPNIVFYLVNALLKDREVTSVCDPWAQTGLLLQQIVDRFNPSVSHAVSINEFNAELGQLFTPKVNWENATALEANVLKVAEFDAVVSILPFGVKTREKLILTGVSEEVEISGDLDSQILSAYSLRLKDDGIGIFVVTPGFFFRKSAFSSMDKLGLCVDAAFELPAGTFAPYTNIPSYIIVVKKLLGQRLFAGKLSNNNKANKQVIANYLKRKESKNIDFGCFVETHSFRGMDALRAKAEFERLKQTYEGVYYTLETISDCITIGKTGEGFEFEDFDNAIYIPLIGKSNVVRSVEDMHLKPQNYAQLQINQDIAHSEFVIRYLNSITGSDVRIMSMSGVTIPKLNLSALKALGVFVPTLEKQQSILEVSHQILMQQNKLTSLMSVLSEYDNKLWRDPSQLENLASEVDSFVVQISPGTSARSEQSLQEWIETLPFPLASILRTWYATSENDPKTKYEHLLHYFEAFSLFTSIIFLSAFRSNETLFEEYKSGLAKVLAKNPIEQASFGTWKSIVEYFSKQVRDKLKQEEDKLVIEGLFQDSSLCLPKKLSEVGLLEIIAVTNKYRNQWTGHGGVVGAEDAAQRNELLVEQLNKLRALMGDLWAQTVLLSCESMKKRGGVYENEILLLMGSNSEFIGETRSMAMPLDSGVLYIYSEGNSQSLPLLPLIKMGSSPISVKNACYFYNRLSGEHEARFVSYHYFDKPEILDSLDETIEVINSLNELGHVQ